MKELDSSFTLIFSVVSFLVAIASTAFKVNGLAESLTNATAWGCVTVLIVWAISTSLERVRRKFEVNGTIECAPRSPQ